MKTKVSIADLYDSMLKRGITFNYHSKSEAIKIIEHTNYYYKVASFRKNFEKRDRLYINCDFSSLIDLATIDMHVRNYLLQMSLSAEHFIKTEISRLITVNSNEDGYSIVAEYEQQYPRSFDRVVSKFENTRYQKEMLAKRQSDMPIWVLMEHMDYSELMDLVKLYYYKYGKVRSLEKAVTLFISARYIRNACAHNSVFILEWFNARHTVKNNASVTSMLNIVKINRSEAKFAKINDLIALFSLLKAYASKGTIDHFYCSGKELLERWTKYNSYEEISDIKKMYEILEKLVDFLDK
ncbi:Abi family protein [Lactococcus lactis]|uniref:Abi family protein n=1 Tax=Lactococcus lactis TaxID=1358 RepID=UPI0023A94863|nr:Abi family protein [Lactococcus lactis]WEA54609.1 Abi family protein [Lactococcus lactis]